MGAELDALDARGATPPTTTGPVGGGETRQADIHQPGDDSRGESMQRGEVEEGGENKQDDGGEDQHERLVPLITHRKPLPYARFSTDPLTREYRGDCSCGWRMRTPRGNLSTHMTEIEGHNAFHLRERLRDIDLHLTHGA